MRYFYAKLGGKNKLAADYLNGRTPIGFPAVPIFFDLVPSTRNEFLNGGSAKEQGKNFFWCEDHPNDARIVALHQGELFILKPAGKVIFWRCTYRIGYAKPGDNVKLLPVEVVRRRPVSQVPAVLSTITANAYYYTGTFRKISDQGTLRALQYTSGVTLTEVEDPKDLIQCLSSIELETLIAKLFEEAGCFVPAYRGGALKDVDILARNTSKTEVHLLGVRIPPSSSCAIQVKRSQWRGSPPIGCDRLISGQRDASEILGAVKEGGFIN